ncbi:SGNH/GDSL hydrolase family protein [Herbiconiux sp. P18]|uniref:SGNH/GDSL hydrolase family protein n=1 Tax=Herbiconiux liangxiaofengii TaxID=3342795 RepID=UPI0035B7F5B4
MRDRSVGSAAVSGSGRRSRRTDRPSDARIRRWAPLVAPGVALTLLLAGCSGWAAGQTDDFSPPVATLGAPWSLDTTGPQSVVTIGDSIMSGNGVWPDEAWPAVVAEANGWQLDNLAEDGAGFAQKGDDEHTFAEQVTQAASAPDAPALIIVSASSNDLGRDPAKVAHAAKKAFKALHDAFPHSTIVGLSAIWGDEPEPPELTEINSAVEGAAEAEHASWLDIGEPLAGRIDLMQFDDTHPTADGQRLLAASVDTGLRRLLAPAD